MSGTAAGLSVWKGKDNKWYWSAYSPSGTEYGSSDEKETADRDAEEARTRLVADWHRKRDLGITTR